MKSRTLRKAAVTVSGVMMKMTLCVMVLGATLIRAAEPSGKMLAAVAQQLLDQDFATARESMRRVVAADGSRKTGDLQQSLNAAAAMTECLIAPFRGRLGQEVSVPFPDGVEVVRISDVDAEGNVKADKLLKVDAKVVGTTPHNFALSDLDAGERFKLLGSDASPEREIMRGLLAWEANRGDAAKTFFAKSNSALGKLLIARVDQVVKDRLAADVREQNAAREAAAARAYQAMLDTAGVESMRKDSDKMVMAIRRKRFSETEVTQIKHQLELLNGELAKTRIAGDVQRILKCFARVRPNFPLEVDQAEFDKALKKLNRDNPKVAVQATFKIEEDGISCVLKARDAFTDLSGLVGIPLTSLKIDGCKKLQDLTPLRGMPLKELFISGWGPAHPMITDLTPLKGMPLERLELCGLGNLTDIGPLHGMHLSRLDLAFSKVTDLRPIKGMPLKWLRLTRVWDLADISPLKGMPLEYLQVDGTAIKDMSPVKGITGLELKQ